MKPTLRSWWRSNKCSKSELVQACADIILLIPTETKKARFTPARSGDNAAYRRWTGLMAPLIEIFGHLDARSFLEAGRAAVPQGD